jgi:hypothetical protein
MIVEYLLFDDMHQVEEYFDPFEADVRFLVELMVLIENGL